MDKERIKTTRLPCKICLKILLDGIMTLKEKTKGITPFDAYNQMEPWQFTRRAFLRD